MKIKDGQAHERIESISGYDLDGDFDEAIRLLQKKQTYYKKSTKYIRVYLAYKQDDYEDSYSLQIWGVRKLTPDEKAKAQRDKADRERWDREYKALKKKFEK